MRILVCGGRDFKDKDLLHRTLFMFLKYYFRDELVIIHGGARGADMLAGEWADVHMIKTEVYPAQWDKYGKRAGYIRNQQMLDEGKPDRVIAFPGGKGTAMMVRIAKAADVSIQEIK